MKICRIERLEKRELLTCCSCCLTSESCEPLTETSNEAPLAYNDIYAVMEDSSIEILSVDGVLKNDIDHDGPNNLTAELNNDVTDGILNFNPDGSFTYAPNKDFYGSDHFSYYAFDGQDYSGTKNVTIDVLAVNNIVGRFIVYNNSSFDEYSQDINIIKDEWAISDKTALKIGETATFENYTSYDKGINEIIIDIEEFTNISIDATDFIFRVGNTDDFTTWDLAPDPVNITKASNAGRDGSDRISIRWEDNAIQNEWLYVCVLPWGFNLPKQDIFFFGNSVGENTGDFNVNYDDVFNNIWPSLFSTNVGIDNVSDINRDGQVNYDDVFDSVWPNLFSQSLTQITPSAAGVDIFLNNVEDVIIDDPNNSFTVYNDGVEINVEMITKDKIAFSQAISKLRSGQKQEEKLRFEQFISSCY